MSKRAWDKRIRKICDLKNSISVWTVELSGPLPPTYEEQRYGTYIGVFRGEMLESAITGCDNTIDSQIYHFAMSDAKRYAKETK